MLIKLAWPEQRIAQWVGREREMQSRMLDLDPNGKGVQQHIKDGNDSLLQNINGAGAEMAAARAYNVYFPASINQYGVEEPDIGRNMQVKSTHYTSGRLQVPPEALDDHLYVLVIGECPLYNVVGHIYAYEAKRQWPLRSLAAGRAPAHWVDQQGLTVPLTKEPAV